ncbi:MAG: TIGR03364 family FAD-dependent oxidoreductase [Bryobacteraceae bacterium]
MHTRQADVAIVGAGILGLAHAYALSRGGRSVVVFDRSPQAAGASVRNFGMIWPIGQPAGRMLQTALRSRELWLEVLEAARLPYFPAGSLHLAYRPDELEVIREFADLSADLGYSCRFLSPVEVAASSGAVRPEGLLGALFSSTEVVVDPRLVLAQIPRFLSETYGVCFRMGQAVRAIDLPTVQAGGETWQVESAIVCTGHDFETLYPEFFGKSGLTRCKLQMMRTVPQPDRWQLGPALAAGLTLRFYESFRACGTLAALKGRIARELPDYERWGIHVLVSQTAQGELTIGDSHEYGLAPEPFDRAEIDALILGYARGFVRAPNLEIAQHWHGVYAKHPAKPYISFSPAPGVRVVTGTSGSGMTLSFGLAEQTLREIGF